MKNDLQKLIKSMSSSDRKYKISVMWNCRKETKGTIVRAERKGKAEVRNE